ncbi:MAG: hypothetical protein R3D57_01685 [Hyphomicrobiaceae bacterium]
MCTSAENEVSHRGQIYRKIALDQCRPLAESLAAAGRKWHSHVLSPGCLHNPFAGVYALVVEDDSSRVPYIAKGTEQFPEVDKELVKLLHGADILDASKIEAAPEASSSSHLLAHVMRLQALGIAWHHHMHFPDCAFNPIQGKWAISVESEDCTIAEGYPDEPVDLLRRLEVIYFTNLEGA